MTTDMTINWIRTGYNAILTALTVDYAWAASQYSMGMVHMAGAQGVIDYTTEEALRKEVASVYNNYVDMGYTQS